MKVLVDIAHPAHVHLFKNIIWGLEKKGHTVKVTTKKKEVTIELLEKYKFIYTCFGESRKGLINKAIGVLETDLKLLHVATEFKPDILIGVHDECVAQVSLLIRKPSIVFTDTEHAKFGNLLTFPFASTICTPSCFKKDLGRKQVRYNGYHELAYLHPNQFKPNPSVLKELGLTEDDKFFILRFVSWTASHDIGQKGFDIKTKKQLIQKLEKQGRVLITSEKELSPEFEKYKISVAPEKIHDLLYYATLYIGEGATMATEAGILGTPSIFISSLAGTMGNFEELERVYQLVYSFKNPEHATEKALKLLENPNLKKEWQKKREKLLNERIDVTKWMTNFIENYPQSFMDYMRTHGRK